MSISCPLSSFHIIFSPLIASFTAEDYEEPSELPDSILPFSQIGPPRNLLVTAKPDGFLITWEPPEYGNDQLGLYIVRYFQQPEHKLVGEYETRNNYLTGKGRIRQNFP